MTETEQSIRDSLLSTLAFLASEAQQREFARQVFYESYQGEFSCWWFDTFYPDEPSSLKIFTRHQLDELRTFSTDFERGLKAIGSNLLSIERLLASPEWRKVMDSAKHARDAVGTLPNPSFQRTATPPLN